MGQVTELVLEGVLCEICGSYVGEPVDYPRKCEDCEENME